MDTPILNQEGLYAMLDDFLREPRAFWEKFYEDRTKKIPFFQIAGPDENLVDYFEEGLSPIRVLELGCGPGRNAIYMAKQGCHVDALDISEKAIDWAKERADAEGVSINFHCDSLFDFDAKPDSYDFVYDCGLFHHLAPHRRLTYIELVKSVLKKDGRFGIVCFNTDGAPDTSDREVYRQGSMNGGIGYSEERFKEVFTGHFTLMEFRRMRKVVQPSDRFGEDFLFASLMRVNK